MDIKCKIDKCDRHVEYKTLQLCRKHYNQTPQQKENYARRHAAYWVKNKEELSEYNKKYYNNNQEVISKRDRQYKLDPKNRFKKCITYSKRRGLEWNITLELYLKLCELPCFYCERVTENSGYGLDRLDNSKGYFIENDVPCCRDCNVIKSDILTSTELLFIVKCLKSINKELENDSFKDRLAEYHKIWK
jgi:hypothetical protein